MNIDSAQLAMKLIKQYNEQHNRLMRATRAQHKIINDEDYIKQMKSYGLRAFPVVSNYDRRARVGDGKRLRKTFQSENGIRAVIAFISKAAKTRQIRQIEQDILTWQGKNNPSYLTCLHDDLEFYKKAPVLPELGKKWQKLVDTYVERGIAYETRWQVRCAIKAFNKMDLGFKIKFGNNNKNGGSGFNKIHFVEVDGFNLPVKKFLENAQFEEAILAA